MVWGGITTNASPPLRLFDGVSLTAHRYLQEVLEPYVRLFRGAVGPNFLFMGDNARPHRAQLVQDYLETEDIQRMEWPARSPDLNPIEHVWDALGRHNASHQTRTRDELKLALVEEWNLLPCSLMDSLILGMGR